MWRNQFSSTKWYLVRHPEDRPASGPAALRQTKGSPAGHLGSSIVGEEPFVTCKRLLFPKKRG